MRRRVVSVKLGAGLIFVDDLESLKRCVPSIIDHVDVVYAVDGIFATAGGGLSTDGSREYLQKFPKVKLIDVPNGHEADKRNAYLRAASADHCDAVLVIDSDSYLVGQPGGFSRWKAELQYYNGANYLDAVAMPVYSRNYDSKWYFAYMNLIYFRPENLEYRLRHDSVWHGEARVLYSSQTPVVNGVLWVNDHDLRSPERLQRGRQIRHNNRAHELEVMPP